MSILVSRLLYVLLSGLCGALFVRYALRRDRVLGFIVFGALLVYVASGLAFGSYLREYRDRAYFSPDEVAYVEEAERIVDQWKTGKPHVSIVQGGYPYWNAAVISVWGLSLTPLRVSNALVSAATIVTTIPQVFAAADAGLSYLTPQNYYDGQPPMKIMEYMGAGLPVLANDVSSHRLLIRDGENGLLVPSGAEPFASMLLRFASEPQSRQRLASAAPVSVAHLTYDRVTADLVLPAYRRLMAMR